MQSVVTSFVLSIMHYFKLIYTLFSHSGYDNIPGGYVDVLFNINDVAACRI